MSPGRIDIEVLRKGLRARRQSSYLKTVLRFYTVFGAVTAVASLGAFLVFKLNVQLTERETVALTLSAVGLATALLSKLTISLIYEKDKLQSETFSVNFSYVRILNDWQRFEELAAQALNLNLKERPAPVRQMISKLAAEGFVSGSDVEILDNALLARNAIAHGRLGSFPNSDLAEISSAFARVLSNLERHASKKTSMA